MNTPPAETCCVCGSETVTYHNYRGRPFCWLCVDCQCAEKPCIRTDVNKPAGNPAECPDACTEHHTYGPDCAATHADYDPNAGMRERYRAAIDQVFEQWRTGPGDTHPEDAIADAVLAARDVYLNNARRISKQQTTQLAELYMATKKRADQAEVSLQLKIEQPAERCGHILRAITTADHWTECVLTPGHQGSHANDEGCRWIERPLAGYCPHCGRGDAGPTAEQYEASQRRAIRIQTILDDTRDRVRKLHRPTTAYGRPEPICAECSSADDLGSTDGPPVDYPCSTITALQSPKETPDA